jgi:2-oxoglutarate ferredoxin oxidoreductase subunit beta
MFNNRIYGLTKGQYSPTSEKGKITKSSPYGAVDYPFNPMSLALGSEATFVAKTLDRDIKHMQEMIKKAAEHKGLAFIEIYQNCVIFNDGAFEKFTDKETKADNVLVLEHGKPMVFGKNNDKAIKLEGFTPKIIDLNDPNNSINDAWVHDEYDSNPIRAFILAHLVDHSGMPTPIGVYRNIRKETYDEAVVNQVEMVTTKKGKGDLKSLLYNANTWEV